MLKSGNEGSGCNGEGKRFVVRADEKLTAFLELESGKEGASGWLQQRGQMTRA